MVFIEHLHKCFEENKLILTTKLCSSHYCPHLINEALGTQQGDVITWGIYLVNITDGLEI